MSVRRSTRITQLSIPKYDVEAILTTLYESDSEPDTEDDIRHVASALSRGKRRALSDSPETPALEGQDSNMPVAVSTAKKIRLSQDCFKARDVTTIVGPEKCEFHMSKLSLTTKSNFFADALRDAAAGPVSLPDTTPELFTIFLAWLVTGDLESAEDYIVIPADTAGAERRFLIGRKGCQLVESYFLAEHLAAPDFKNAVMDHIIRYCKVCFDADGAPHSIGRIAHLIYSRASEASPLRRVLLHEMFAMSVVGEMKAADVEHGCVGPWSVHEQFWMDLAGLGIRVARGECVAPVAPWDSERCVYHEHPDKPEGYICSKE